MSVCRFGRLPEGFSLPERPDEGMLAYVVGKVDYPLMHCRMNMRMISMYSFYEDINRMNADDARVRDEALPDGASGK
ncbi:MAG: hypothetical protein ACLU4N_15380 [Butyricimonas faecihominis]